MAQSVLDQLKSSITGPLTGHAASLLGETPANIDKAIAIALPTILSGAGSAATLPSGQSLLHRLVTDKANDGTLLNQLPALYQGTMTAAPSFHLGHQLLQGIFGSKLGQVTQSTAAVVGIKPASTALLYATLAPHVLAVLAERHRATPQPTAASLAAILSAQREAATAGLPSAISQIFHPPVVQAPVAAPVAAPIAAAAVAAMPFAAARLGTPVASQTPIRRAAPASAGLAPWVIFPAGFLLGTGLLGLGTLLLPRSEAPAPTVIAAATPQPAPVAKPVAAPVTAAVAPARPTAPGVTTYFGATPPRAESQVVPNPNYTPAVSTPAPAPAAVAAKVEPTAPKPAAVASTLPPVEAPRAPGVTSYFGQGAPTPEMAAVANPDYKPTPIAAAPQPAPQPPAQPLRAVGTTTFFGPGKPTTEAAAIMNPDYKPTAAPAIPQPAAQPPAQPPRAVGTTTYFGPGKPTTEMAAVMNPNYKPAPAAPVAPVAPVAPAAKVAAAPPPVPAAAPVPAINACRASVAETAKTGRILFEVAKANLKPASTATLDQIAAAIKACPNVTLRVEGHTDDMGAADMNLRLSQARAQSVVDYLLGRGIEKNRLKAIGLGLTRPLVPNTSQQNMALNRRIDFIVDPL